MTQDKIDLRGTKILVVDDVSANINVLYETLTPEGYDVLAAPSGEVALKIAPRAKPDLILLDIMMPGIDGFETCRRLKSDKSTADITIIFVTARGETESIVEGFQIGGVDYIIKPFQHEEVRARVRTHLTIKRLQDELREANDRLREANIRIEAQKRAAEQELQDAHQVQMSLMPNTSPKIDGVEIAGRCVPANTVGGDYFNYIWLDEAQGKLGIVLMDVTGHGMKAATTTFLASGMLQSEIHSGVSLEQIMAKMNQILCDALPKNTFVAMSLSLMDTKEKTLTHFNAGVPVPVIIRNGKLANLEIPGAYPLGCWARSEYIGTVIPLQSADLLVFHSDGILEATNEAGEMYADERFAAFLTTLDVKTKSAQEIMDEILINVGAFLSDEEESDDMTVVVAKVL